MTQEDWLDFFSSEDVRAFHRTMTEFSLDDTPRFIYADWLDDHCPDRNFCKVVRNSIRQPWKIFNDDKDCFAFGSYKLGFHRGRFLLDSYLEPRLRTLCDFGVVGGLNLHIRQERIINGDEIRMTQKEWGIHLETLIVNLEGRWTRVPHAETLSSILESYPNITKLQLHNNGSWNRPSHLLKVCEQPLLLRDLYLRGMLLTVDDLRELRRSPLRQRLLRLNLKRTGLTDDTVHELMSPPTGWHGLESLNLANNRFGDDAIESIAFAPGLTNLKNLNLSGNPIGDRGALTLANAPQLAGLEALSLTNTQIGHLGAQMLATSAFLRESVRRHWRHLAETM